MTLNASDRKQLERDILARWGSYRAFSHAAGISTESLYNLRRGASLTQHILDRVTSALGRPLETSKRRLQ